jgi:hypothetical protein
MALVPYVPRGGGRGGGGGGGGGLGHGCLPHLIEIVVVLMVVGGLIDGGALEALARHALTWVDHVVTAGRILAAGVAVVAMMVGGFIAVSPTHRRFGYDMALGGLLVLVLTAFGPTIVRDVQNALPATTVSTTAAAAVPREVAGL